MDGFGVTRDLAEYFSTFEIVLNRIRGVISCATSLLTGPGKELLCGHV